MVWNGGQTVKIVLNEIPFVCVDTCCWSSCFLLSTAPPWGHLFCFVTGEHNESIWHWTLKEPEVLTLKKVDSPHLQRLRTKRFDLSFTSFGFLISVRLLSPQYRKGECHFLSCAAKKTEKLALEVWTLTLFVVKKQSDVCGFFMTVFQETNKTSVSLVAQRHCEDVFHDFGDWDVLTQWDKCVIVALEGRASDFDPKKSKQST